MMQAVNGCSSGKESGGMLLGSLKLEVSAAVIGCAENASRSIGGLRLFEYEL